LVLHDLPAKGTITLHYGKGKKEVITTTPIKKGKVEYELPPSFIDTNVKVFTTL
jgi:hypothetical protein